MKKEPFQYLIHEPDFNDEEYSSDLNDDGTDLYYESVEKQIEFNRSYFKIDYDQILKYFGGLPLFNSIYNRDEEYKMYVLEESFAISYKPGTNFFYSIKELLKSNNVTQMQDELFVICSFLARSLDELEFKDKNFKNPAIKQMDEDAINFKKLFEYVKINVTAFHEVKGIIIKTGKGDFVFKHEDSIYSIMKAIYKLEIKQPIYYESLKFDEGLNMIILRLYHFIIENNILIPSEGKKTSVQILNVIHGILDLTGYLRKMKLETDIHFIGSRIHRLLTK